MQNVGVAVGYFVWMGDEIYFFFFRVDRMTWNSIIIIFFRSRKYAFELLEPNY